MANEELNFINKTLVSQADFMIDLFQRDIDKKRLRDTDALRNSFKASISASGGKPTLRMSFYSYGRALDIRFYKKRKDLASFKSDTHKDIWGIRDRKKKRKRTNWYARNFYGSANRLFTILSTEYKASERKKYTRILHGQNIKIAL